MLGNRKTQTTDCAMWHNAIKKGVGITTKADTRTIPDIMLLILYIYYINMKRRKPYIRVVTTTPPPPYIRDVEDGGRAVRLTTGLSAKHSC